MHGHSTTTECFSALTVDNMLGLLSMTLPAAAAIAFSVWFSGWYRPRRAWYVGLLMFAVAAPFLAHVGQYWLFHGDLHRYDPRARAALFTNSLVAVGNLLAILLVLAIHWMDSIPPPPPTADPPA